MDIKKLPMINLIRKPGRSIALILLTALLALSVFGGSIVVLSLRQGLKSLESRLGADIIVVPSSAQSINCWIKRIWTGSWKWTGLRKPRRRFSWRL